MIPLVFTSRYCVVAEVRDEDVTGPHSHTPRVVQLGRRGRPVVEVAGGAVSGKGGDHPRPGHHADFIVGGVGDVDVARRVHGHPVGVVELGAGGRTTVAGEAARPRAGEPGDDAARRHLAHLAVLVVRDVGVAGRIGHRVLGLVDLGRRGRPVVTRVARRAGPGERVDRARCRRRGSSGSQSRNETSDHRCTGNDRQPSTHRWRRSTRTARTHRSPIDEAASRQRLSNLGRRPSVCTRRLVHKLWLHDPGCTGGTQGHSSKVTSSSPQ